MNDKIKKIKVELKNISNAVNDYEMDDKQDIYLSIDKIEKLLCDIGG